MGGFRITTLGSALALIISCSPPEEQLVKTFLLAAQGGDEAMVSGVSLVKFPGSVASWEILEIGPESKEPFPLAEIRKELADVESQIKINNERHANFLSDNAKMVTEYRRRIEKDPNYQFTGEMADFKTELDARTAKQKELQAKFEEVRGRMTRLRDAAQLSVNTVVNENFEGEVKGKTVRLKVNDGSQEKVYSLSLRRFELKDTERNLTPMPRWIITDIQEQA
jgi:hypothetical protein